MAAQAEAPMRALKPSTLWVATSDEWAQEAEAVYGEALAYVTDLARTRAPGSWAVVLDLDETVINNVAYQIDMDQTGQSYSSTTWHVWTQKEAATLVPGVMGFIEAVNRLGGHVAFVTNRSDREQLATENNLAALGIDRGEDFRVLLTRARPAGASSKDGRFGLVPALLAAQGYSGVEVVAFVGDNVGDKPAEAGPAQGGPAQAGPAQAGTWQFFCIDQGAMYGEPCAAVPGPGR